MFVGVGAIPALILFDGGTSTAFTGPDLGFVALAFGLIVAGLVYTIGKVSGCHINPAVSVALAATRRFPWREVPGYTVAQLSGAVIGAFLIWGVFGDRATKLGYGFGVANFDRGTTSWGSAMLAEALAAGILVFVVLGAIDRRSPPAVAGLVIGLTLAAIIVTVGPVTGSSTNPARSFGPLLVQTINGSGAHNWLKFLFAYVPGRADRRGRGGVPLRPDREESRQCVPLGLVELDGQSSERGLEMVRAARPDDDGGDARVGEQPRERQRRASRRRARPPPPRGRRARRRPRRPADAGTARAAWSSATPRAHPLRGGTCR